jgi:hypothetical protein
MKLDKLKPMRLKKQLILAELAESCVVLCERPRNEFRFQGHQEVSVHPLQSLRLDDKLRCL